MILLRLKIQLLTDTPRFYFRSSTNPPTMLLGPSFPVHSVSVQRQYKISISVVLSDTLTDTPHSLFLRIPIDSVILYVQTSHPLFSPTFVFEPTTSTKSLYNLGPRSFP